MSAPSPMDEATAVTALAALAQPQRLRIFRALVGVGPAGLTPTALATALDVPPSTLSFHLKELVHADLVTQERDGRQLIYRPAIEAMNRLLAYLTAHCCLGSTTCNAPSEAPVSFISCRPQGHPMQDKPFNVLFICTRNSARSILAEAILRHLGGERFQVFSAGSQPAEGIHPMTLQTLTKLGLPTQGLHSKDWTAFGSPDAPPMEFVFTVCDQAAGETCPTWPGQPITAHWGVMDPVTVEGSEDHRLQAFSRVAVTLKRRIELMLALPMAALDRLSLQSALDRIGETSPS